MGRERQPPPEPDTPKAWDEAVLVSALRSIAHGDCWNDGTQEDGDLCHCPVHEATRALDELNKWRFRAALPERLTAGTNPREARIVQAFEAATKPDHDRYLATILKDDVWNITRRDWWVATSVVQWLATNIGMSVLERAGFKYTRFDEDRELVAQKIPASLLPVGCEECQAYEAASKPYCAGCGRRLGGTR